MNKANNYWANYLMSLKRAVRYIDALINFRHTTVSIDHAEIKAINPLFWSNICQEMVNQEIACYFKYISPKSYDTVVDAGAAIGLFSMAMALGFNCKRIYSFEPSLRQRILLYRNVRLNRLSDKVEILPYALWNAECTMPFRTIGDMSSLEQVHQLPNWFRFSEKVRCVTLDQWLTKHGIHTLDLLKMDI